MAGILDDAVSFYAGLEADNSPEFWDRERYRYDDLVRPVFTELLDGVRSFGSWRVYRPHNDTRFGNAEPYKSFAGAVAARRGGCVRAGERSRDSGWYGDAQPTRG